MSNKVNYRTGNKTRLHLTAKRKRKTINAGLLKWRSEQNKLKNENNSSLESTMSAVNSTESFPLTPSTSTHSHIQINDILQTNENNSNLGDLITVDNSIPPSSPPLRPSTQFQMDDSLNEEDLPPLNIEYGPPNPALDPLLNKITGRYIVDGQHFLKSIRSLETHRERCLKSSQGWFKVVRSRTRALFWYLDFECPFCKEKRTVTNEPLPQLEKTANDEQSNKLTITEGLSIDYSAKNIKSFYLKVDENTQKIKLKETHDYYFQVQGQLHITEKYFCDFIVWTPSEIFVERIVKNDEFWSTKMETNLVKFYHEALLPELVDPRLCRKMPIRDI